MLVAVDDDGARLLGGPELDHLPPERLRHLLVRGVVFARLLAVVFDPFAGLRVEDLRLGGISERRADRNRQRHTADSRQSATRGSVA